jgi:aspartyl-tRNA(Asn)/glutamyl-tRNA(Gln) amidotransferase subunit A
MHFKTLTELKTALANKELSSVELITHYLKRIERLDSTLNSFITVTAETALQQAKVADSLRTKETNLPPLLGLPMAHKDLFCTDGVKTSCGSKMLDNFIAPYDATLVKKCKQAGLISLGKTNMDEFAMGSSTENSFYGPSRNPWNTDYVPGGSSGGSAAAVAAGLVPFATGTDTGGSIRQPAALCGITGLKPTYGRISRYGMVAFASSLDQGGPFARSAEDIALLLNAMTGFDEHDSTSLNVPTEDYTRPLNNSLEGMKIGLPKEYFSHALSSDMQKTMDDALKTLEKCGAKLVEISLPHSHLAIPTYYVIAPAECSSNLSRYDGVRFGYRCEAPKDLTDLYMRSRGEGFGHEVKRRILIGTYVLSAGYYDAYYLQAQKVRQLIKQDFDAAFKQVDAIATPTTPTPAFKVGEKVSDPVTMYQCDIYTLALNLAGLPGLSMPAGFINGLPVGMQLMGHYLQEAKLLNIAHQYQQQTNWHLQHPTDRE